MRHAIAAFAFCAAVTFILGPSAADELTINGSTRTYIIKQPAAALGPQPTVIVLHAAKNTGASVAQSTKLDTLAPQHGFVAVFPDGQRQQWNFFLPGKEADFFVKASGGRNNVPDDGAFLKGLIGNLVQRGIADAHRIYIVGESNGGLMALRMMCTDSDLFAGIALLGSAMPETVGSDCHPSRPLPALIIKGTKDETLPYGGGLIEPSETFRVWPTDRLVGFFQQLNDDRGTAQSFVLPRKVPNVVQIDQWANCSGIPLAVYRVIDGAHSTPADLNAGQVVLDFFASPALQVPCVASLQNPASGAGGPQGANASGNPNGQGAGSSSTPGDTNSNPNSPTNGTGPNTADPNTPNGPTGPNGTSPGDNPGGSNTAGLGPPPDNNNAGNTAGLGPPPDGTPATSTAGLGPPPDDTPTTSTAGLGPPPDNTPGTSTAGLGPPTNSPPPSTGPGPVAIGPPPTALPPVFLPIPIIPPVGQVTNPPMCPPCHPGCMASQPNPPQTTHGPPGTTKTGAGTTTALAPPTLPPPNGGTIYGGTCNTVGKITTCTGSDGRTCTSTSGACDPGISRAKPEPTGGSGTVASPAPLPPPTIKSSPPPTPPPHPNSTASTDAGNQDAPKLPTTTAMTTEAPPSLPTGTASTTPTEQPHPPKKKDTKVSARRPAPSYNNNAVNAAEAAAAAAAVVGIIGAFRHGGGGGGGMGNICHH